jgi:hypothetical protein
VGPSHELARGLSLPRITALVAVLSDREPTFLSCQRRDGHATSADPKSCECRRRVIAEVAVALLRALERRMLRRMLQFPKPSSRFEKRRK